MFELLAFFYKGESKKTKDETKYFLSAGCSSLQLCISPRSDAPPPHLTVLDTLAQGGQADPISWRYALPIGGQNTPYPDSIYLQVPCGSVWSPSNALDCPPSTILSQEVINACLLQKGQTISLFGRWGLVESKKNWKERGN